MDINAQYENHTTLSHLQSNVGPVQIAQALLDHGANINARNNGGETSLYPRLKGKYHIQCHDPVLHGVELVRDVGVNVQNKNHSTPLHLASFYGALDLAKVLLDCGVTANSKDKLGRAPLHLVAEGKFNLEQDRIRLTQLLLELGVDVNAQDDVSATPLHLASYEGRVAIARVLLDRGASVNSKDNQGRTPLHSVAEGRYLYSMDDSTRVAQLLLERGADVNALDEDNITPLHLASYYKKVEIARVLLDGDAATNPTANQGRTPLHVVAEGYSRDDDVLAQLLLERGADIDAPDDDIQTPLHLASHFGRVRMAVVLLNAGANASANNAQGQTPLHLVSQSPHYSNGRGVGVAQLLLKHGADVNAQDKNQATPLDFASYHGRTNIASFLLLHGGKTNAIIDPRPTPLQQGLRRVRFYDEDYLPI